MYVLVDGFNSQRKKCVEKNPTILFLNWLLSNFCGFVWGKNVWLDMGSWSLTDNRILCFDIKNKPLLHKCIVLGIFVSVFKKEKIRYGQQTVSLEMFFHYLFLFYDRPSKGLNMPNPQQLMSCTSDRYFSIRLRIGWVLISVFTQLLKFTFYHSQLKELTQRDLKKKELEAPRRSGSISSDCKCIVPVYTKFGLHYRGIMRL